MAGDEPPQKKSLEEIRRTFQVGDNGISQDYANEGNTILQYGRSVLKIPGWNIRTSEEESRSIIFGRMKVLRSYSEYMKSKYKIDGLGLEDFLTKRGEEIIIRLDQIAIEIGNLILEDPKKIDVIHVLELLEESRKLIYEKKDTKEDIPAYEEVYLVFKKLTKKEVREVRKIGDEEGLYLLDVTAAGDFEGEIVEYSYRRGQTGADKNLVDAIQVTYYENDIPISGTTIAEIVDGKWAIL